MKFEVHFESDLLLDLSPQDRNQRPLTSLPKQCVTCLHILKHFFLWWKTEKEIFLLRVKIDRVPSGNEASSWDSPQEMTSLWSSSFTPGLYCQPFLRKICFWRYSIYFMEGWIMSPQNPHVEILTHSTLKFDCIWKYGLVGRETWFNVV